jgi:NADPH-dependent curcumin reductase CurA
MGCSVSDSTVRRPVFLLIAWCLLSEFAEYFVESDPSKVRVLPKTDIPVSAFLGVAGMPGQTAVYSWKVGSC